MQAPIRIAVVAIATLLVSNVGLAEPSASVAATSAAMQTIDSTGGGQILAGTLGDGLSLDGATHAMLARIHRAFGTRPTVVRAVRNRADQTIALLFTDVRAGRSYTGVSVVIATPGSQASGVALYDTTSRFPKTVRSMLHVIGKRTLPSPSSGSSAVAPAEALVAHPFPDGTGSIGVPATWTLKSAGGGSALAVGPSGREIAAYNSMQGADDPSYGIGLSFARGVGVGGVPEMRASALKHVAFMRYTDDKVLAWTTVFDQMARQSGKVGPHFVVKDHRALGADLEEIDGSGTAPWPITYVAYVGVTPPNGMGQWSIVYSYVIVPSSEVASQGATAAAVLNSVRIDQQAFAGQNERIRKQFQRQFDAEIALDRAQDIDRQARTDRFMANDRIAQEGMHKQAVAMENFSLDRAVVVNTRTGAHGTVGTDFAAFLEQADSRFQPVAASDFINGVDY